MDDCLVLNNVIMFSNLYGFNWLTYFFGVGLINLCKYCFYICVLLWDVLYIVGASDWLSILVSFLNELNRNNYLLYSIVLDEFNLFCLFIVDMHVLLFGCVGSCNNSGVFFNWPEILYSHWLGVVYWGSLLYDCLDFTVFFSCCRDGAGVDCLYGCLRLYLYGGWLFTRACDHLMVDYFNYTAGGIGESGDLNGIFSLGVIDNSLHCHFSVLGCLCWDCNCTVDLMVLTGYLLSCFLDDDIFLDGVDISGEGDLAASWADTYLCCLCDTIKVDEWLHCLNVSYFKYLTMLLH